MPPESRLQPSSRMLAGLALVLILAVLLTALVPGERERRVRREITRLERVAADRHREHRPEAAVDAERVIAVLDPGLARLSRPPAEFLSDFAEDLIDAGRYAQAVDLLRMRAETARDAVLLAWLGTAYRMDGREAEAEQSWLAALVINPKLARPWLDLGKLDLRRGRPGDAIARLRVAASLGPEAHEPAYQLSVAYRRLGDAAEADRQQRLAERLRAASGAMPRFGMSAMPEDDLPLSGPSSGSGGR